MSAMDTERTGNQRQQILTAAQRCFLRNGLHGTSMADVARESGLSEARVEAHFGSREDLIQGIVAKIERLVSDFFEEIQRARQIAPIDELIGRFADTVLGFGGPDGPGRLALLFWASALYDERMAEYARAIIGRARSGWIEIAERERAAGRLPAGGDAQAVGVMLACLVPGILTQDAVFEDVDAATFRRGVEGLFGSKGAAPRT